MSKNDITYKCDDCEAMFKESRVKLIKPCDNINIAFSTVMFKDKNGKAMRGDFSSLKEGDKLLACPACGKVHLFGFNTI